MSGSFGSPRPLQARAAVALEQDPTQKRPAARTECGDHQHQRDVQPEELDGEGLVEVDILAGAAMIDDERFTFGE